MANTTQLPSTSSIAATTTLVAARRPLLSRAQALAVFLVYLAALFGGTHWPRLNIPPLENVRFADKVIHFLAYLGLTALLVGLPLGAMRRADGSLRAPLARYGLICWLAVAAWALMDEWTQPWVGRDFEWLDLVADTSGAMVAIAIVSHFLLRRVALR